MSMIPDAGRHSRRGEKIATDFREAKSIPAKDDLRFHAKIGLGNRDKGR